MTPKLTHDIDMIHGSIFPKIFMFSVPLAFSSILQLLFNAADVVVLGRFVGSDELAAVGSTASMICLLVNFFIGLSAGVNVTVSASYAAGRSRDVSRIVHTSVSMSVISGFILLILGEVLARPMLVFMGSPDDILSLSLIYVRIYFAAVPFILIYNFGAAILRSIGDTKRPFIYLLLSGIINLILNLIFVLIFDLGVVGVAVATSVSNVIAAILIIAALIREDSCLKLDLRKLILDKQTVKRIMVIGLPAGIQSAFFNISNVLIQSSVNSLGKVIMAGNSASISVEGFYTAAYNSITSAAVTFTSANYGAGRYSRIDKVRRCALLASLCVCSCLCIIFLISGRFLLGLFTTDTAVVECGFIRLRLLIATYVLASGMDIMTSVLRGLGKSLVPMIITLFGAVGLRLFWIFAVFSRQPDYALLLCGYPVSWLITFLILSGAHFLIRKRLPREDLPLQNK